ncbi:hypothetical protein A2686_00365 [Candidatus Woesebacteria bacterium RIFCSPHIGHO2_01_FULL_38_10]|uniref:Tr-type G domain-containing protein n=1 Tax=Candidatus Woesebacteria bacterium RIFCSPLOWO2_01_FULL_39_10b TaxID=1802517 RepID=A0A1F8BBY2_9BACT|nr:MAG: hypothetical protein A2686_00365 [Candidatus Woesebacteria bacterium RIFCSPHIGHO2_01_FULL_38_10]OGM60875.1 MAG: hypothetical protein A2892_04440 [Candidatus Woesebacteria bacterium RIFCSPLOWO2_01_FULL_39_10b]
MEKTIKDQNGLSHPPVVCVLGHVDHGKTTLLDKIRKTSVAEKESGGITQSIGASIVVTKEGKKITFIDTPGHAAFANMRSQGARVADIAILVVAGDDGVKPQTKEALNCILTSEIPFIVAVTKIDLPSSQVDSVKAQLEKEGVVFEGKGGDVPLIAVSAKTGEGMEELLEMIVLVSELANVKGEEKGQLESVVIETGKDKRGIFATVIIRNGKLEVGEEIVTGDARTKIRGIFDHQGKPVKKLLPGEPGQIIGFSHPPAVGSKVWHSQEKKDILEVSKPKLIQVIKKKNEGEISVVIKAKSAGSLEAILSNLPKGIFLVDFSVGDVNESDIFMAKPAGAYIFAFESKTSGSVKKLAEAEGVGIYSFKIIYELFEKLEKVVEESKVQILGKAKVIESFPYDDKRIAGCKLDEGKIAKTDKLILTRNEKKLGEVKIISIKKGRQVVEKVKQGEEFGVLFTPQLEFKVGDVLISERN